MTGNNTSKSQKDEAHPKLSQIRGRDKGRPYRHRSVKSRRTLRMGKNPLNLKLSPSLSLLARFFFFFFFWV
ncbi:hypothetical protein PRUPE_5G062100 [Prunus persica]|uniref:Uncharacterized protein n=1 Tax=Prunus persica TaxID=3760 RepID=M5WT07_PRUPE|nr:hypothetical protein PRUPE_5G062100 [Prunus persica]